MSIATLSALNVDITLGAQQILRNVSLDVRPGEVLALVGPNGTGKSTLLRALCGEARPSRGNVVLNNIDLDAIPLLELARKRSVMTQNASIAFDYPVKQVLAMGWANDTTLTRDEFHAARDEVVRRTNIAHLLERRIRTLSGGELQRTHFARALLQLWPAAQDGSSHFLLLDEPTSALDMRHELELMRELQACAAAGAGVIVVVHDLNLAARFATRCALLSRGQLACIDTVANTLTSERLSEVYETPVEVYFDERLQRPQVRAL